MSSYAAMCAKHALAFSGLLLYLGQDMPPHLLSTSERIVLDAGAALNIAMLPPPEVSSRDQEASHFQGEVLAREVGSKIPKKIMGLGKF